MDCESDSDGVTDVLPKPRRRSCEPKRHSSTCRGGVGCIAPSRAQGAGEDQESPMLMDDVDVSDHPSGSAIAAAKQVKHGGPSSCTLSGAPSIRRPSSMPSRARCSLGEQGQDPGSMQGAQQMREGRRPSAVRCLQELAIDRHELAGGSRPVRRRDPDLR